jgi:hypothetical protein
MMVVGVWFGAGVYCWERKRGGLETFYTYGKKAKQKSSQPKLQERLSDKNFNCLFY